MPLFRNKFQPKKCPPRKASIVSSLRRTLDSVAAEREFGVNADNVQLNLGNRELRFENGEWHLGAGKSTPKKMSKEMDKIQRENNLLKIEVEILMDMLTQTTMDASTKK